MTKSELIEMIARKQKHLPSKDVELAVKHLLDLMSTPTQLNCLIIASNFSNHNSQSHSRSL